MNFFHNERLSSTYQKTCKITDSMKHWTVPLLISCFQFQYSTQAFSCKYILKIYFDIICTFYILTSAINIPFFISICILQIDAIIIIALCKSTARPKNWQFNGIYSRQQHAGAKIAPPQNCILQFCGGFSRLSVPIAAYQFVKLLASLPRIRYNSCKSTPFYEVRL